MEWRVDPSLMLYLPLYELDGGSFVSRDSYGHLVTRTGAVWTPRGHSLDGIDDALSLDPPAAITSLTTQLTVIVWANVTPPDSDYETLLGLADIGNNARQWYMTCSPITSGARDRFMVHVSNDGTADVGHRKQYFTNSSVFDSRWHMYSFTWRAGILDLQVDGASVAVTKSADDAITALYQSAADLEVGCSLNSGVKYRFLPCIAGEAWVFGRALALPELQRLHLSTRWRYR